MPAKRSAMRKIKEVLRLKFEAKLSHDKIAAATGMSKGAVTNAVQRPLQQSLAWPLPAELDEAGLEALMYRKPAPPERYTRPDYATDPPSAQAQRRHAAALVGGIREGVRAEAHTATASSACIITNTAADSPARCAKCTAPGRRCSSITAAIPSR